MEKWVMFVLTHTGNFNPRGIFVGCSDHHGRVFPERCSCRRIPEVDYSMSFPTIWEKKIRKKRDERYLILTQLK